MNALGRNREMKKHSFFFFSRFYLFDREREHKQEEQQAEGEGEADSQLSREPNVGLNPKTSES